MRENMTSLPSCPVCQSQSLRQVITIPSVPAHCCILWNTQQEAVNCPKGDIHLTFCDECGHLYNPAFDERLMAYSPNYENSLHFSPRFQEYSKGLIRRLTESYQLYGKDIIDIGCGKGDFLKMICSYGHNRGYGFDKSYQPELEDPTHTVQQNGVEFVRDYYSEKYAHYPADFIVSRYVFEHIPQPRNFLQDIKNTARRHNPKITFYFEVPNILYTLRDMGIWDLIYEHCSYFSAPSLTRIFESLDFDVLHVEEKYMGQFLSIEAQTVNGSSPSFEPYVEVQEVRNRVDRFALEFQQKMEHWKNRLTELQRMGQQPVVWGGGAKCASFLNFLDTSGVIEHIVDINPRKKGKYMAGSGQEYIMPEDLKRLQPDTVILMNPIYENEIRGTLRELELNPDILIA